MNENFLFDLCKKILLRSKHLWSISSCTICLDFCKHLRIIRYNDHNLTLILCTFYLYVDKYLYRPLRKIKKYTMMQFVHIDLKWKSRTKSLSENVCLHDIPKFSLLLTRRLKFWKLTGTNMEWFLSCANSCT